jgi:hypothetical protein
MTEFIKKCKWCKGSGIDKTLPSGRCVFCWGKGNVNVNSDWHTSPLCPTCGSDFQSDWYEYFPEGENDECVEIECPDCDSIFKCKLSVNYKFESKLVSVGRKEDDE